MAGQKTAGVALLLLLISGHASALQLRLGAARAARPTSSTALSAVNRRAAAAGVASALVGANVANAADLRWAASEFFDEVKGGAVERVTFASDSASLVAVDADGGRHEVALLQTQVSEAIDALRSKKVPFAVQAAEPEGGGVAGVLANLVVPAVLLGGLLFLLRGGGQGGGGPFGGGDGPMGMLQSRAKLEVEPETGVTFADVAGCDQSKLELEEVVEFLRAPEKFEAVGAQCPRGVVLEGPPGTGKTLLARAVAGEAGVPFISTSGSEFVEMFVGVGASRIRSLFADAKKNAPCIIFIDEIDAIGRQRSSGGGFASNDEREQTLNQILTEMDGFAGNSGVIVIAATNRADILDSALLRPGRFDRRVPVDLPDKTGRVAILKVHSRDKPLSGDFDLDAVAARSTGFSGAMLQNLMNEAAIFAVRSERDEITMDDVDAALDRLTVGQSKSTGTGLKDRNSLVAWHEAGHAVMAALTPGYDPVAKVTIIPRTNGAGGFTLFTPSEDRMDGGMYSYRYLLSQLAVALGGRVAEEMAVGGDDVTTGASNDLQQVRNIARRMVAQWGFRATTGAADPASPLRAPVAWEEPEKQFGSPQTASKSTEKLIDRETRALIQVAYDTCTTTLKENRVLMEKLVDALLEHETVDGAELEKLVRDYGVMGAPMPALA